MLASGVLSLGALIFVAGIAIAPALAAVHSLAGQLAERGTVTEAYTWLGTGMGAGIAIGAAMGGAVVEGAGTLGGLPALRDRGRARRAARRRPPRGASSRPDRGRLRALNPN